ncbi:hypothetical protein HBB16_13585 [Pseudonocardia sp. MCCB 268]|nr:hypothetical protein [Pseudonocardia cytotoxica]
MRPSDGRHLRQRPRAAGPGRPQGMISFFQDVETLPSWLTSTPAGGSQHGPPQPVGLDLGEAPRCRSPTSTRRPQGDERHRSAWPVVATTGAGPSRPRQASSARSTSTGCSPGGEHGGSL